MRGKGEAINKHKNDAFVDVLPQLFQKCHGQQLAMFKIFTKSLKPLLLRQSFLNSLKKEQMVALSHQLLTEHQNFKGWKTVRLLHSLTMAKYDPEVADSLKQGKEFEAKIEGIMEGLSSELHLIPQREVNMLMQVLKQRGYTYDRTVPLFKALNKQAKLLFGRQYRASQLLKSLQLCKQINLPKQTWVKMVSSFLEIDVQRTKKEENLRMSVLQFMRLAILVLEQPYVPLTLTKSLVERLVKENATNLDALTTLYHISRIITKSLKAKADYQLTRSNVKEILFNPYSQMEEQQPRQKEDKTQQEEETQQKQALRNQLNEATSEILKIFFSAVDTNKLEQQIVKSIEADIQPLTKQNLIFASDIPQLRPTILHFLQENLQKLTPVEFFHLLRKAPSESAQSLLTKYEQKLGKYMNIQQRTFSILESHRFFRTPITVQTIISLINSAQSLTYDEFLGIMQLVKTLPQSSHQKIPQILRALKKKTGE